MSTKRLEFIVPSDFRCSERLLHASPDEIAIALSLSSELLVSKDKLVADEYAEDISTEINKHHELHLKRLFAKHQTDLEEQLQKYQEQIDRIQTSSLEKEKTLNYSLEEQLGQHQRQIDRIQSSSSEKEKSLKKNLVELEVSLHAATQSQDILRQQFLEEAERRIKQQKESDMMLVDHLRSESERLRSEIKSLEIKIQAKQAIQNNSSRKGKEGEALFEQTLLERKGWVLSFTGSRGHEMDYSLQYQGLTVRFEVKDYATAIPTKEVEKMKRDLKSNPETDIGVFVSLNTTITGYPTIQIEWSPLNQLVIYIPQFLQIESDIVLQYLETMFLTVKPYRRLLASQNSENPMLQERLDRSIVYAQNALVRVSQTTSQFILDIRALQDKVDELSSHQKTNLAGQKEELRLMLEIITGQTSEEEHQEEKEKEKVQKKRVKNRPSLTV